MLTILIVDDREDARATLKELIEAHLPTEANVSVEDSFPLDDVKAYASVIREKDVAALLLDERLNERKDSVTGKHISYFGHDVVGYLRASIPDFPVYVVTTYRTAEELVEKEAEFEDVVERDDFSRDPHKYTSRILRSAMRFQESMSRQLTTLNDLTVKAALGILSAKDHAQLVTVRQVLGLPFTSSADLVVSDLIADARNLTSKAENLMKRLKGEGGAS